MEDVYGWIFGVYKTMKYFPKNSYLKINPKQNSNVINLNQYSDYILLMSALLFSGLFSVLFIMIIAAVINYEVIFRGKELERKDEDKDKNIDEIARDRYYSKPENKTGLAVFVPLLVIMVFVSFVVIIYSSGSGK